MSDQVRVLRIMEYIGDRKWVEETVKRAIHGTRSLTDGRSISAVTLHEYPEVLRNAGDVDAGLRAQDHSEQYDGNLGERL